MKKAFPFKGKAFFRLSTFWLFSLFEQNQTKPANNSIWARLLIKIM